MSHSAFRRVAGAMCTVAATLLLSLPASALELDAAAMDRLRKGEPVTSVSSDGQESAAGTIQAVIDVPAPPAEVWKILTDCDINVRVIGGLKSCKVVSRDAASGVDVREHLISWSRLLPTVRSVFRSEYVTNQQIRFSRTEGDLKRLDGEWKLETQDAGKGTRLRYRADLALGIPVPSALVRSALESDMPKTMRAIRQAAIDGLGR
jgi:carbon monoxide dehydrogenase subunit G